MIIKGGSRQNRRFFARHLLNTKDNDRVRVIEVKGFSRENIHDAFLDMDLIARGTNCKNFFYHATMNPGPDETLTEEQKLEAVNTLERNLGLEGLPRFVIEHEKKGREHFHVVWQRIDPDTMTARSDSLTYAKHEAAAREIEKSFELQPVPSVLVKNREEPRPDRRPKDFEGFRASQTGLKVEQVTATVTDIWGQCDTGSAFRAALQKNGYLLCRGDRRDFVLIDPAGKEHSIARRIEGVKAADVRARLKDIDPASLPSVAEGRELANAWEDNDAARAVRDKALEEKLKQFREPKNIDYKKQDWFSERMGREGFEYEPEWSTLEVAAQQYGRSVKDVMGGAQSAYWQAVIGGRPKTEADKWHELVMGKRDTDRDLER